MDEYLKCLTHINETVTESSIADFEFTQPREAIIFSQWMGATLPIDKENVWRLQSEREGFLPYKLDWTENSQSLLSESIVSINPRYLRERRYVSFIPPLASSTYKKMLGKCEEFNQSAYGQIMGNIVNAGLNPQAFVLVELDRQKYIKYNEAFWEYVAGCYLREKGYLVTKWTPDDLRGGGRPDMGAYKTPSVLNPLVRHQFVKNGCFLVELELPLTFGLVTESSAHVLSEEDYRSVVVEAKSKSGEEKAAENQLIYRRGKGGYLEDGHFDEGYIAGPDFKYAHKVGSISNKRDGELLFGECRRQNWANPETKARVLNKVKRLAKLVLIKSLPFNRIVELCRSELYDEVTLRKFLDELSSVVECMTVDDACSLVQQERLNRPTPR